MKYNYNNFYNSSTKIGGKRSIYMKQDFEKDNPYCKKNCNNTLYNKCNICSFSEQNTLEVILSTLLVVALATAFPLLVPLLYYIFH